MTTIEMPKEFLPVWKNFEGLSDKDRSTIIVLINNLSSKNVAEPKTSHDTVGIHPNPKRLFITPAIKALEKGFNVSSDISDDYKKELADSREKRFL